MKQEASSCYCDISLALHTRFLVCTPHTRRGLATYRMTAWPYRVHPTHA